MELETRLRVAIRPNRFEYEDKLDNKHGFVMIEPHNNSVYAKLSNECFESMIITLSPFAGDDLCAKVQQLLIENNLDNKVVVRQSVLTGEISVE